MLTGEGLQDWRKPGWKANVLENRRTRRFKVQWAVEVKGTDHRGESFSGSGMLDNLSSTGAFIYLARPLRVGTRLDIWIKIPFKKENWMKYSAEVVRVERAAPTFGIAMAFDNVRPVFETR